jgi:catenin delta-2
MRVLSSGIEQHWRNPDLEEVIEYLCHTSDTIKENAAAYLQHLCYNDDSIKSKTRSLNGITYLIALLNHEKVEIQKNACGALRNLCYGKRNEENKVTAKFLRT